MTINRQNINKENIPEHIAIIMDGNGRWAKAQNKDRSFGHQAGAETVHAIAEQAAKMGVKYLTLYTFSSENWDRPQEEIAALMDLLMASINEELLSKNNICFNIIGEIDKLPQNVQEKLQNCINATQDNTAMHLVLALSYSSYWEITEAAKQITQAVLKNQLTIEEITAEEIQKRLSTSFMPNPDLLIRTGGEYRLSNYLLWQCAYTELYFCDTFWPDFSEQHFINAIIDYQSRERRFGKISEQVNK